MGNCNNGVLKDVLGAQVTSVKCFLVDGVLICLCRFW